MTEDTTNVKVARLEERVGTLQNHVTDIKATLAGQDDKLDRLLAIHHQRKGARAMTKAAVAAITSGGFLGWLWEHFNK